MDFFGREVVYLVVLHQISVVTQGCQLLLGFEVSFEKLDDAAGENAAEFEAAFCLALFFEAGDGG